MPVKTAYHIIQNAQKKKPRSKLRKFSKRDNRSLEAIKDTGAFDQGGITTFEEMHAHGLFQRKTTSCPFGTYKNQLLSDTSDALYAVFSRPGGGKGTCIGFPVMATWGHSSIVIDVDGEYARGVSGFRRALGHVQRYINADELFGFPSDQINPFERIKNLMAEGREFEAIAAAREAARLIVPDTPERQNSQNYWIDKGAHKAIEMALIFLAKDRPDECHLAGLLALLRKPVPEMLNIIGRTATTVFAVQNASAFSAEHNADAQKQVQWKIEQATENLELVQPGSPYDFATRRSSFDPRSLKSADRPVDIYLMVEGRKLETEASYLSLLLAYLIEEAANAPGERPVLVLADEFSQLSKNRTLIKAMRAYRKRKIKILTMSQGRQSTIDRYGKNLALDIEDMAGTRVWIDPPYQIARELSEKGGNRTALSRNVSHHPDGGYSSNYHETKLPHLNVAELSSGGGAFAGKMIVEHFKVPGLIVADKTPWWEIHPFAEQLSDAYRDDFYRYEAPAPEISKSDALNMFGLTEPYRDADILARLPLLQSRFSKPLIAAALKTLEPAI